MAHVFLLWVVIYGWLSTLLKAGTLRPSELAVTSQPPRIPPPLLPFFPLALLLRDLSEALIQVPRLWGLGVKLGKLLLERVDFPFCC
ncbi:MAG: hypothetical protein GY719_26035 [bacterium]|nr:hypothetical protein [bacterium]